jgi:hypothetical protein
VTTVNGSDSFASTNFFCVLANFNDLGYANPKIFGLFDQARRTDARRFRRINKVESDEILGVIHPNVETVTVVRFVWDELTVIEGNPIFFSPRCVDTVDWA